MQLKCRTVPLKKPNSEERGNVVHFEVRKATFNDARKAYLVAGLFNEELTEFVYTWLIPMELLPKIGRVSEKKYVIRPSISLTTTDRCSQYRCVNANDLARGIKKSATDLAYKLV